MTKMSGEHSTGGLATPAIVSAHAEIMLARVDLPLFKAFIRHKEPFEVLVHAEVFEMANGKAIVNFHDGRVQSVVLERRTYQHQSAMRASG